ncbi:GNAT family N-acetyltransferase [Vibrio coralliilyticus]|uniref:GNAT family N-acetyltransferase n=1 Tax=Vibrio coralliilyticus TaxID=190893 RepID=UPI00155FF081|nr:GNAT family protein [Vibrio coralliilyticus]NRF13684.1 GNAT family N-acetyltransferase [Vibrio coralliilyticus]
MFTISIDSELELALVQESFATQYSELVSTQTEYLSKWLTWPPYCQSEQDFRMFVQRVLHEYADGKSMTCAIIYNSNIVGNCSFNTISYDTKTVEIGYWLSQHQQGKGIITRVVNKLIDIAFNEYQMEKVQLSAAKDNLPSRRVAERVGMTLEGIITNKEKVGDRILDHAVYGIHRQNTHH